MEGRTDGWMDRERSVSPGQPRQRMTPHQDRDGRMRGWMQIMMVEYKKEGRKEEEGRRDKNRDTKQEKSTFFWAMQS